MANLPLLNLELDRVEGAQARLAKTNLPFARLQIVGHTEDVYVDANNLALFLQGEASRIMAEIREARDG